MYLLLNKRDLTVPYKNENPYVLCNLAWIEIDSDDYVIAPVGHEILRGMSLPQLQTLYLNITGNELVSTGLKEAWLAFIKVFESLEVTTVDQTELECQAGMLSEEMRGFFKYQRGSGKPTPAEKGVEPEVLHALISKMDNRKTEVKTERVKVSSGQGSIKTIIWREADRIWELNGKPLDKGEVIKVRKLIMDELELAYSIKRTSASSELGNWHKARAPY